MVIDELFTLAQHGGPPYGHRDAYETGRKIGEVTAQVMACTIVLWLLVKLFKRR